jgi:hypothetical protein
VLCYWPLCYSKDYSQVISFSVKLVKYIGIIRYVNFVVFLVIMSWYVLMLQLEKVAMGYEG